MANLKETAQRALKFLNKSEDAAAGIGKVEDVTKAAPSSGLVDKLSNVVSYPQRKMMASLAEKLGVPANPESSEESAQNIVEKIANKLGVPPESVIGNMAKAGAVAGLEVFGDPTNLVPGGSLKKLGKVKNLIKPGTMKAGELAAEKALPAGQKIVQKITSGPEYKLQLEAREIANRMKAFANSILAKATPEGRKQILDTIEKASLEQAKKKVKDFYGK